MPKRSNEFQTLIALIESALANASVQVTESKLVKNGAGVEREIDIALEGAVNDYPILVAIECRDHKRKRTVEWVDQVIGKYDGILANKVVLVSRNGFTKEATRRANEVGYETLSLIQAQSHDWAAEFRLPSKITIESFLLPVLESVTLVLSKETKDRLADIADSDLKNMLIEDKNSTTGTLATDYIDRILNDQKVIETLREKAFIGGSTKVDFAIKFDPPKVGRINDLDNLQILEIKIVARCKKETMDVPLTGHEYRNVKLTTGKGQSLGRDVGIAFISDPAGETTAHIRIAKKPPKKPK